MKLWYTYSFPTFVGVQLKEKTPITDFAEYLASVYELFTGVKAVVKDVSDEVDPKSIYENPKTIDTILTVGTEQNPTLFLIPGTKKVKPDKYLIKQPLFFDPCYTSSELPPELRELHSGLLKIVENPTVH